MYIRFNDLVGYQFFNIKICFYPPKKCSSTDSDEEIEVEKIMIGNSFYYKTKEDVILDIKSHEIKGILVNGNIESINQ